MTLSPGTPVYVSGYRCGEAAYVRQRRDGRHVVRWASDGAEHTCRPADTVRALERTPPPPGEIVRPFATGGGEPRAVPKSPPVRSRSYLAWIRGQECAYCTAYCNDVPSEASHHVEPGHGSTSSKCHDTRAIPLCRWCHADFHADATIGDMDAERTRAFVEAEIAATLTRYLRDECGWTAREINTRLVRVLSEMVEGELSKGRRSA